MVLLGCVNKNPVTPEKEFFKPSGKLYMIANYYHDDIDFNFCSEVVYHYYDKQGRLSRKAYAAPNSEPHKFEDYEYSGDFVYIRTNGYEGAEQTRCISHEYKNGLLVRIDDCDYEVGEFTRFTYDEQDRISDEWIIYQRADGTESVFHHFIYEYSEGKLYRKYNALFESLYSEYIYEDDRLMAIVASDNGAALERFYYDESGNLIKKEEFDFAIGFEPYHREYTRLYYYYE